MRQIVLAPFCMALLIAIHPAAAGPSDADGSGIATDERMILAQASKPDAKKGKAAAKLSEQDRTFIKEAAAGGKAEVAMGKMAAEKAASQEVQAFAKTIIKDHTKANQELMQLAKQKGITPPAEMDAKHEKKAESLKELSGRAFDRQYIEAQVKDHQKTIDLFQSEAEKGQDPELKAFAKETLPTLKEHLQKAKSLQSELQS